ncbi:histidine kinase dimerization/phospho-acceptor domain-containing protein [Phreatobacter sp. AB_2022a]|uniref:histidine kinase dimerization/phospho-acceptor domain-containing protein n=1 Tax=Phreatobacter sp. AB_2022a TaxID=3003134 RepID=UPI0022874F3A|nr:histidine kinase dimerization/phospho-acceptor domain-containing protein [Phreatobacter sp. AB_2022a]MCZ0737369.1 ATP-binding protein [Phreatobacter sp. AB_2022a]
MTSLSPDVSTVLADPALAALVAESGPWWLWSADGARLIATNATGARAAGVPGIAAATERSYAPNHPLAGQVARMAPHLPADGAPRLERLRLYGRFGTENALAQARRLMIGDAPLVVLTLAPAKGPSRAAALAFVRELTSPAALFDAAGAPLGVSAGGAPFADVDLAGLIGAEAPRVAAELDSRGLAQVELVTGRLRVARLPGADVQVAVLSARERVEPEPGLRLVPPPAAETPRPAPASLAPEIVPQSALAVPRSEAQPAAPTVDGRAAGGPANADAALAAPPRFSWRIDADGRFAAVEPAEVAAPSGLMVTEALARFGLDPDGGFAAAIAAARPFSGVAAAWPLGTTRRLSVTLAAFPHVAEGAVRGFAGFGLVTGELAPVIAVAAAPDSSVAGDSSLTASAVEAVAAAPEAATQPALETAPSAAQPADVAIPPDAEPDEAGSAAPDADEPHAAIGEPEAGSMPAEQPGESRPAPAKPPGEDQRPVLTVHTNPPNVVALRSATGQDMKRPASLSPGERNAFREIAKALGAEPDADEEVPSKAPASAERNAPAARLVTPDAPAGAASQPSPLAETMARITARIVARPTDADGAAADPAAGPHDAATAPVGDDLSEPPAAETAATAGSTAGPDEEPGPSAAADDAATLADEARPQAETEVAPAAARAELVTPAIIDAPPIVPPRSFVDAGTPFGPLPSAFGPAAAPVPPAAPSMPSSAPAEPANAEAAAPEPPMAPMPPLAADADTRALLDRVPLGLLVHRGNSVLMANRTLLDWTGYASEAALEAAGGVARVFAANPGEEQIGAGAPLSITAADGSVVPVEARLSKFPWAGDKAFLFTLTRIDPAGLADGEAETATLTELRGRLEEVEQILDTATDGIVIVAPDGAIESMNRSAEALFGYESAEMKGRSFTSLFAPESHRSAIDYCDGLLANGVASVLNDGRQIIGRVKQGGLIPLYMTMGRTGPKARPKLAAVFRDMTQWKKAEEDLVAARRQAEQASSQKSDFLAKISHEIRTPLNAIIGFSEVMMEERFGPIGNERYRDYLKDIHASGGHVLSLINDLLDLSKIEAGKLELSFTSVDLNDVVQSTVAIMQPQANRDRVIIRSSLQGKLPNVVADVRSLRQIALNLLSNSVKFTPAGGQIIVSTALSEAGEAVLRVRDTGVGMTDAELQAAMEPFRQVATTNPQSVKGTGLGLPLTKALVEANRASFGISSAPNQGTLVEVVFPATRVLAE